MAKDISAVQGMGTDTDYLNGNLVKNQTLASIVVHNDIMQFFQKLMYDAGLTANDDYDNKVNGYQFLEALVSKIRENTFQSRGNSSADFVLTDLTTGSVVDFGTSTSTSRSINSIIEAKDGVGANPENVLLGIYMNTSNTIGDGWELSLVDKDFSSIVGRMYTKTPFSAGLKNYSQLLIPLDSNNEAQYRLDTLGSGGLIVEITVLGWNY